jgi:hypothetical protein
MVSGAAICPKTGQSRAKDWNKKRAAVAGGSK